MRNASKERNADCPICASATEPFLEVAFGAKLSLPVSAPFRECRKDNFVFLAAGKQQDYDEYYRSQANDSYHGELASGSHRSPISMLQQKYLLDALAASMADVKRVLDFGCGEGSLLIELALGNPGCELVGYDLSPAIQDGARKAQLLGLTNVSFTSDTPRAAQEKFDLVIASHLFEHLLTFELISELNGLLDANGWLYVEVPDALRYQDFRRTEFLYYFDRLHVNHFTPESLATLLAQHSFDYARHFTYQFPYRDGGEYPALGMLFRKGAGQSDVQSPRLVDALRNYVAAEQARARQKALTLASFEGLLVWGGGDNFFRSLGNGGPLASRRELVLLDQRSKRVTVGDRTFETVQPEDGISRYPWPVVLAVSEGRSALRERIHKQDPSREIFDI